MLFPLRIQIGLGVQAHQIITQPMPSGHVGGSILQVVLGHAMHIQANLFHQCFSTTKQHQAEQKSLPRFQIGNFIQLLPKEMYQEFMWNLHSLYSFQPGWAHERKWS